LVSVHFLSIPSYNPYAIRKLFTLKEKKTIFFTLKQQFLYIVIKTYMLVFNCNYTIYSFKHIVNLKIFQKELCVLQPLQKAKFVVLTNSQYSSSGCKSPTPPSSSCSIYILMNLFSS
jgi:hypothetical protein